MIFIFDFTALKLNLFCSDIRKGELKVTHKPQKLSSVVYRLLRLWSELVLKINYDDNK